MSSEQAQETSEQTAAKVAALLAAYQAGQMTAPDLSRAVAASIYVGKAMASHIADKAISATAGLPPLGLLPGSQHMARLEIAAQTALADDESAPERLTNLAESEVLTSHQKTLRAAIEGHGFSGYREDVAADACEVCQPYADAEHDSSEGWEPHHPRCRCELVPLGEPEQVAPQEESPEPLMTFTRAVRTVA